MRALDLNKNWWIRGLFWGMFMFLFMGILFPLLEGESIKLSDIRLGLVVWIVFGLIFGAIFTGAKREGDPRLRD